jgi:2-polyprenyl-3-methyl-5-hydroxy-6-metoxy-1,4-benzoquinol methylase
LAEGKKNKKILELGSGRTVGNKHYYSAKHLFDEKNDFIQSDVVKDFGHQIVDVTKMKYNNEFDIILCLNVLEHVYDYEKAIKNIYQALKEGGTVAIAVPAFYPLHDEPHDYWRFTEHSLRKLLSGFKKVTVAHKGKRQFPLSYYVEAVK